MEFQMCEERHASATFDSTNGLVTIQVKGAAVGAVYYVSIKYNPGSLVGQKLFGAKPTVKYTFKTLLNGTEILTSWDSVNVVAK